MVTAKQQKARDKFVKKYAGNKGKKKKTTRKKLMPKIIPANQIELEKTNNEFYREYKKLKGKKSKAKYMKLLDKFHDHTSDIFTGIGDSRYKTRNEALYGFKKAAKIDWQEVDRVFDSVNNVHAYT